MERTRTLFLLLMIMATLEWQCIDKYNSPYQSPATGYLVVEGYIAGNGPTQFTLSRTIPLPGDSAIPMETGAKVQVEGSDNSVYPLAEQSAGVYTIDTLALNTATQYRLRISTSDGQQYLSYYTPYKPTPPIDSITWSPNSSGVNIYAYTHDPTANTRYYQWNYTETWQYTSAEQSEYVYDTAANTVLIRTEAQQVYNCWTTDNSSNIIVGTSIKLAQDVIAAQPIQSIPANSQQLSLLYSILVRQYALTDSAYSFLALMQQNTESLGSIFDPTPSQLTGNIQCLTNPSQPVIGWVSAGTVQQERIFISRNQLPGSVYYFSCPAPDHNVPNIPDSLKFYFGQDGYVPVSVPIGAGIGAYISNFATCVDCTLQGGINVEPSFWPN